MALIFLESTSLEVVLQRARLRSIHRGGS